METSAFEVFLWHSPVGILPSEFSLWNCAMGIVPGNFSVGRFALRLSLLKFWNFPFGIFPLEFSLWNSPTGIVPLELSHCSCPFFLCFFPEFSHCNFSLRKCPISPMGSPYLEFSNFTHKPYRIGVFPFLPCAFSHFHLEFSDLNSRVGTPTSGFPFGMMPLESSVGRFGRFPWEFLFRTFVGIIFFGIFSLEHWLLRLRSSAAFPSPWLPMA